MTFNERFSDFAKEMSPTRNEEIRSGQIIEDVLKYVRDAGCKNVDRITPSHRTRKTSAVSGILNVDIYIYINSAPPFTNEISQLTNRILFFGGQNTKATVTGAGIFFKHEGINFALKLAKNFLPHDFTNPDEDDNHVRKVQHAEGLQLLKYIPEEEIPLYITSLSCTSILFEEKRDSFSHSMSRLAKYWFSQHRNADQVVDGFRIMEYLGARVAEEERLTEDLSKGFSRFLTMMTSPEHITVFWMEYYDSSDIPENVRSQRPLLLDPCNPYNNMLAYGHNNYYLRSMKGYAKNTLERLDDAEIYFKRRGRLKSFNEIFYQEASWSQCALL